MKLKKKPSGVYFIDLRDAKGSGPRISLDTREPSEAAEQFRLWKLGVHPKQLLPVQSTRAEAKPKAGQMLTLGQGLDLCLDTVWAKVKTYDSMKSRAKQLKDAFGDTAVDQIDLEWLEELVSYYRTLGKAEGTIKRLLESVSKVLVMAAKWKNPETGEKWIKGRPEFPKLSVRNFRNRVLLDAEERKVFAAIEARRQKEPTRQWWRFAKLVRFLIDTGFRLNEALGIGELNLVPMRMGDRVVPFVMLEHFTTKSEKPRMVPLSDAIQADLPALREQAVKNKFFPLRPAMAWYMWNQIRDDLGGQIDDITLHTLRHTCATRLIKGKPEHGIPGIGIYRLKEWLGHSDIKITAERYAHLDPEDLSAGLAVLNTNGGAPQIRSAEIDSPTNGTVQYVDTNRAETGTLCH